MITPSDARSVLAVPHDLVLPAAALDRLRHQFDRLGPLLGVVAPVVTLTPGSSVTTAADRAAMAPLDRWMNSEDHEVHGAVLLAPGVDHTIGHQTVRIERHGAAGGLVVDPGAASFDPRATATVPAPLADDGRPPFRWRPLVLVLAGRPDPHRAQVGARLADALLDHDVEARLAVHDAPDGPLRTGPLVADPSQITALRPDLVIALDPDAADQAQRARPAPRSMVVAIVDDQLGDRIELVPWSLAVAHGRLRARIGERAHPGAVAELVNRLCSGPVPDPPADPPAQPAAHRQPDDGPPRTTTTAVTLASTPIRAGGRVPGTFAVLSPPDTDAALLAGLVDHLIVAGWRSVSTVTGATEPNADLVLYGGPHPAGDHLRGSVHVVEDITQAHALAAATNRVSPGAPRAIAASDADAAPLRAAGIDTLVVAVLPTRARLAASTAAVEGRVRPAVPTIAVVGDSGAGAPADTAAAAALGRALDQLRNDSGELDLVSVGGGSLDPAIARHHPRRLALTGLADAGRVTSWTAAVLLGAAATDDRPPAGGLDPVLLALALAGVPVVLAAERTSGMGALADRSLAVAKPTSSGAWAARLAPILDDANRAVAAARARRIATALTGPQAAGLVVQRILGWVDRDTQ